MSKDQLPNSGEPSVGLPPFAPPPVSGLNPQPMAPSGPNQPLPQVVQPTPPPVGKASLRELLNKVKCHNIALTDGIGLGDALERLAAAISRSGVKLDENGNPTRKEVNRDLGRMFLEVLERSPRAVEGMNVVLGYDPIRPMFLEGEALSVPLHSEMVMLLPKGKSPPIFPDTDNPTKAAEFIR